MSFDAIKFLEDFDIPHRNHGQKTTKGWVQVRECPLCCADGFYFGINLHRDQYHCWLCDKGGKNINFLIYRLLKVAYHKAKEIAAEYGGTDLYDDSDPGIRSSEVKITGMTNLQKIHIDYLESRGYDYRFLERRYQIGGCYTVGRFPYRIVIPVYDNGIMVTATSRDVTGLQTERYISLTNEESIIPIKESVYNIDAVAKENILVVEGPFDVWRIGGATVSLFGTAFKTAQVMRILAKSPSNVYILFDNEPQAQKNASNLASCFAPLVKHVEVIEIPIKDPAMLSAEQAIEIRNELQL